jgi:hypothetical protein
MSYSPPNTFVNGTTLTAADMEGNFEALRLYLHEGIAVGDMAAVQWVDSRHIQPARYDAFTGVQHGVTGHQGVQWSGGAVVNLTFATKFLTGQGAQTGSARWHRIPNTAFSLDIRRPARTIFHWHAEVEVGPDASPGGDQAAIGDRHVWLSPYRQVTNDLESSVSAGQRRRLYAHGNAHQPVHHHRPIRATHRRDGVRPDQCGHHHLWGLRV